MDNERLEVQLLADDAGFSNAFKNAANQMENFEKKATGMSQNVSNKLGAGFSDSMTKLQGFNDTLIKAGDGMNKVGSKLTLGLTLPLVGLGAVATKAAIDYESAFAGVRKTVDMTESEFSNLSDSIRQMSKEMPASAVEIAGVGEAAGQLGIHNDKILEFSDNMIKLGVATNMSSTEAATSLARFANITQMSQTDFGRLGSTIVALGNNFATTESEITEMGLRLAGAGKQIGLTEAQTMGIAAALSSVGIEAEAGGSAFSKLMVAIQLAVETGNDQLGQFADVAGLTVSEFSSLFKTDAVGAINAFTTGLGTMDERGKSSIAMLDEMGINEVRLRDAILRTAGAGDLLTQSVGMATQAWSANNALNKEAEERYKTTESQMQMASNRINDFGITMGQIMAPALAGGANALADLAEGFQQLNPGTQKTIVYMGAFAAAIGPVLKVTGSLTKGLGSASNAAIKFVAKTAPSLGISLKDAAAKKVQESAVESLENTTKKSSRVFSLMNTSVSKSSATSLKDAAAKGTQSVAQTAVGATATTASAGVTLLGRAVQFALGPIGIATMAIGAVVGAFSLMSNSMEESTSTAGSTLRSLGDSINGVSVEVDDKTQEMADSFEKLSNDSELSLAKMKNGMDIKNEGTNFVNSINSMAEQAVKIVKNKGQDLTDGLTQIFADYNVLSVETEAEILKNAAVSQEQRVAAVQSAQEAISGIYNTALNEGRELNTEEISQLSTHMDTIRDITTTSLTDTNKQALALQEQLNNGQIDMTQEASQAMIEIFQKSADERIETARTEAGERLSYIEQAKNLGIMSEEQYATQKKAIMTDLGNATREAQAEEVRGLVGVMENQQSYIEKYESMMQRKSDLMEQQKTTSGLNKQEADELATLQTQLENMTGTYKKVKDSYEENAASIVGYSDNVKALVPELENLGQKTTNMWANFGDGALQGVVNTEIAMSDLQEVLKQGIASGDIDMERWGEYGAGIIDKLNTAVRDGAPLTEKEVEDLLSIVTTTMGEKEAEIEAASKEAVAKPINKSIDEAKIEAQAKAGDLPLAIAEGMAHNGNVLNDQAGLLLASMNAKVDDEGLVLSQKGQGWMTYLAESIALGRPITVEEMQAAIDEVNKAAETKAQENTAGADIANKVTTDLTATQQLAIDQLNLLMDTMNADSSAKGLENTAGADIVQKTINDIIANKELTAAEAEAMMTDAITRAKAAADATDAGSQIPATATAGVTAGMPGFNTSVQSLFNIKPIPMVPYKNQGAQIPGSAASGITGASGAFTGALGALSDQGVSTLNTREGQYKAVGLKYGGNLVTSFKQAEGPMKQAATGMGAGANQALASKASETYTLGGNWGDGVVRGILSRQGAVASAAISLANVGNAAYAGANKIASPSKVGFALGGFWGDGIIGGVGSKISEMDKTAVKFAEVGNNALENTLDIGAWRSGNNTLTTRQVASLNTDGLFNLSINIEAADVVMDGQKVGHIVFDPVYDQLAERQATLERG